MTHDDSDSEEHPRVESSLNITEAAFQKVSGVAGCVWPSGSASGCERMAAARASS